MNTEEKLIKNIDAIKERLREMAEEPIAGRLGSPEDAIESYWQEVDELWDEIYHCQEILVKEFGWDESLFS